MISLSYTDKLISHTQDSSTLFLDKTVHTWKFGNTVLAMVEVDERKREFKILSLDVTGEHHSLLPRLAKCLAKTLRIVLHYQEGEKLPHCKELFNQKTGRETQKKLVYQWVKSGGDPNGIFFEKIQEKKLSHSLIVPWLDDLDLVGFFLESGFDPNRVTVSTFNKNQEVATYTWTLAYLAVSNRRIDLLELLIKKNISLNIPSSIGEAMPLQYRQRLGESYITPFQAAIALDHVEMVQLLLEKGKVDLNTPIFKEGGRKMSLLSFAAQRGHVAIVKLLLEAGARFFSKESLGGLVRTIRCNKTAILELLISHFPISSFRDIEDLDSDSLFLFLEIFQNKNNANPPNRELTDNYIDNYRTLKYLGHKFGISILKGIWIKAFFSQRTLRNRLRFFSKTILSFHYRRFLPCSTIFAILRSFPWKKRVY